MPTVVVTRLMSQAARGWLKLAAFENIPCIEVTLLVFHAASGWSNDDASPNMPPS